ncbi:MAG: hypothetical protein BRD37_01030 [Bacteroidetes bacterium QH_8_67_23]|nr:MAG: hypothetical protein BRD37_01030 [Bacteroidetes bacterium QH_8_67_23]
MVERQQREFDNRNSPLVLLWSGGKDALLALLALEAAGNAPRALVTTVAGPGEEVTMHGVGLPLVRAQAQALGLPLVVMRQPKGAPNEEYERLLGETLAPLREEGVEQVAAGDLFLEDLRAYREDLLRRLGFDPLFPLWQRDTGRLARRFVEEGHRAVVCSVDTTQLDAAFAGRFYDRAFLDDLPAEVDPCGERGAFHTFVCGGPRFREPVPVERRSVHRSERTPERTSSLRSGRMARAQLRLKA